MNDLNEKEKYYINVYNTQDKKIGYNIANGGNGGDTFFRNPNINNIKNTINKTHPHAGNKNGMYGRHHTENGKNLMRIKKNGRYDGIKNPRAKPVYEYDNNLNFIKKWEYCKLAADYHNISRGNLSAYAKFNNDNTIKYKKLKGLIFSFSLFSCDI